VYIALFSYQSPVLEKRNSPQTVSNCSGTTVTTAIADGDLSDLGICLMVLTKRRAHKPVPLARTQKPSLFPYTDRVLPCGWNTRSSIF
jgi:hypothetical protein